MNVHCEYGMAITKLGNREFVELKCYGMCLCIVSYRDVLSIARGSVRYERATETTEWAPGGHYQTASSQDEEFISSEKPIEIKLFFSMRYALLCHIALSIKRSGCYERLTELKNCDFSLANVL